MRSINVFVGVAFVLMFMFGCAGTRKDTKFGKEMMDDPEAMKAVAESITGQKLDDKQLRKLSQDLKNDPEARQAVKMVTESVQGNAPVAKYSPVTGKRYAPNMEYDPETGVKLLPVE